MKKSVLKTVSATTLIMVAVLFTFFSNSCKKSTTPAVNFAGSYAGTDSSATGGSSLGTLVDTITITQAIGSSTLTITSNQGAFDPVTATASGSNITIPTQSSHFMAATANVAGNGSLVGSTLKLNVTYSLGNIPEGTGNFWGTKQ